MQRVSQSSRKVATTRAAAANAAAKPKPVRVAAAIIEVEGRLLICRRPRGRRFAGQWEFAGGKIQAGETPRVALRRELREELGSESRIGREVHRLSHAYGEIVVDVRFFRATLLDKPRNRCFARILWVPRGDLPRYKFLEGNRQLVARLARGRRAP